MLYEEHVVLLWEAVRARRNFAKSSCKSVGFNILDLGLQGLGAKDVIGVYN